ncbi:MAG: RNA polymerase sigma factor [Planctomycetes bacterium]|nr:RNA polymerase sigma factor [Planctomycetota bacterium]
MTTKYSQLGASVAALLSFSQPAVAAAAPSGPVGVNPSIDTVQIVLRARGGDAMAFADLYERFAAHLLLSIQARLRRFGRIGVEAPDIAQETWRRALVRFPTFEPARCPFRRWIVKIGKNVLSEQARRHRRHRAGSLNDVAEGQPMAHPGEPVLFQRASRILGVLASNDEFAYLLRLVRRLGRVDAEIVVQHAIHERSHADIARRLSWTVAAVTKRWQRAIAKLRRSKYWQRLVDDPVA